MKNNPPVFPSNPAGLMMWAVIFMWLALFSCGRKTLPVPPDVYIPTAVKDLSARLEAGVIHLTWIVPDGDNQLKRGLSEMVVFQAERSAPCQDCPLSFKPIATIFAADMAGNDQGGGLPVFHSLAVDRPGRFAFYVAAYSKIGLAGPSSDMIEIDCTSEGQ